MLRQTKILILVIIFLVLQFLILSRAQAEYRVYRLGVTYEPGGQEQQVLTTLDNLQYETYYKITPNQTTRIIEHWMCRGRTDNFTPYCEKPVRSSLGSNTQASNAPAPAPAPPAAPAAAPDQGPVNTPQKN